MLRKMIFVISVFCTIALLSGCKPANDADSKELKVGTIAGPETQLMEVAEKVAKECYGLDIDIVTFTDYNMPNIALNDGSLDANMFQHLPYLHAQIAARGYKIVSVGKTFVYPMGIYSKTLTNLQELQPGSKVAIPNDPSNEARALLLLQKAGLITLKPGRDELAGVTDIVQNPKKLQFIPLAAAQLPRSLSDVAVAAINTNYAIPAGLLPTSALYSEGADSPYANIVAARAVDAHSIKIKELVAALHSKAVLTAAKRIFGAAAIPAWNVNAPLLPCKAKGSV